jgi:hypothetical protein
MSLFGPSFPGLKERRTKLLFVSGAAVTVDSLDDLERLQQLG